MFIFDQMPDEFEAYQVEWVLWAQARPWHDVMVYWVGA